MYTDCHQGGFPLQSATVQFAHMVFMPAHIVSICSSVKHNYGGEFPHSPLETMKTSFSRVLSGQRQMMEHRQVLLGLVPFICRFVLFKGLHLSRINNGINFTRTSCAYSPKIKIQFLSSLKAKSSVALGAVPPPDKPPPPTHTSTSPSWVKDAYPSDVFRQNQEFSSHFQLIGPHKQMCNDCLEASLRSQPKRASYNPCTAWQFCFRIPIHILRLVP